MGGGPFSLAWERILRPASDGTDPRSGACDGATPVCAGSAQEPSRRSPPAMCDQLPQPSHRIWDGWPMGAPALEFRLLGPLEALVDGVPAALGGPRQRAVLALLLAHRNEVVPADRLIDGVWDEEPPETAANVLQGHVSHLRRALGRDVIVTRGRDYAVRVPDGALDLHRFERLAGAAAGALAEGRPRDASAALHEALGVWRGPALSDLSALPAVRRVAAR